MKRISRASESIPFLTSHGSITRKTMYLGTREVPEIDGSQGAFIAVVVILSVLIVVCCAAVFYLLRYHEPTDQERAARREHSRRTREQTLNSSSTFSGPSTFSTNSLGDKVKQMWQSTTGRGHGRRGGRGWIRAGSDDEWASHSDHEGGANPDPEIGSPLRSLPSLKQDARDGVRIVESPSSDSASGFGAGRYGHMYTDPFSKAASDGTLTLQRSQSPLSSPMSSPREGMSVDESHDTHSPREDRRHCSVMSNASVWTHGSKFVEDI